MSRGSFRIHVLRIENLILLQRQGVAFATNIAQHPRFATVGHDDPCIGWALAYRILLLVWRIRGRDPSSDAMDHHVMSAITGQLSGS
jgi:hypothetical protein